jgi:hypothetical protein
MVACHERLYGLEAPSCFSILFGPLLHGATIVYNLLLDVVNKTSNHYRIAAFSFLLSGYFALMVYRRTDVQAFLTKSSSLIPPSYGDGRFRRPLLMLLFNCKALARPAQPT